MLLVDSGGHYLSGTTDVTRTVHLGTPTEHQRRCYTRVLQGHVDLARAVFPRKVKAFQLDVLARLPLYQVPVSTREVLQSFTTRAFA